MSSKGFTPKGAYVGGSDVFGAGRDGQASKGNLADGLRGVDELRRTDSLEIQRELQQDRTDIEDAQAAIESLQRTRVVAFARITFVAGAVTTSQLANISIEAIGSVLTLKFDTAPTRYVVQCTMGDAKPAVASVIYRVTERATEFDIEQRTATTDAIAAWPTIDTTVHVTVSGVFE